MATECYPSIVLGTLLIFSVLLSTWTVQHSVAASHNMARSIMNRRLAIASSMSSRREDPDLDFEVRTRKLDLNLRDWVTNGTQIGRAFRADNLINDSESVTMGEIRNLEAEMSQTSSNSSKQPQPPQLCEYTVVIQTGKQDGAGTDSDISLRLSNKDGDQVYFRHLANGHRTFEKGHEDTFVLRGRPCIADICQMVLYTDDYGFFSEWFVVSLRFSVATLENDDLLGPIVQEKVWVINEWLPKEDDKEELFTIRDDCTQH